MNSYLRLMRSHAAHTRPMLGTLLRLLGLAALLASAVVYGPSPAHAAAKTFKVTKTADTADGKCDAHCSLREAIIAANANSGWDTIVLPAGAYTLSLGANYPPPLRGRGENKAATGDLDITDDLTIYGANAATTIIDGNALDRVFEVSDIATVKLLDITVRNGSLSPYSASSPTGCANGDSYFLIEASGGGILNCGHLTLFNSVVQNNQVEINGGGIYNAGTLAMFESTVSGNTTARNWNPDESDGGGIYNIGTAYLSSSTVSGNRARLRGGGIANFGGELTLTNSTISGNRARVQGGGIDNMAGPVWLNNSTIAFNTAEAVGFPEGGGGGISNNFGDYAALWNTILARNVDTSGQAPDCVGSLISGGYNLVRNTMGCAFTSATGDLLNVDPKLGPLQNNGGRTWTHALQAASPAIDTGNPATPGQSRDPYVCSAADQRGVARPKDGNGDSTARCDIGAVERQSVTTP